MIVTVPKWRVAVTVGGETKVFWVHDSHIENVLRLVAGMSFTDNPLVKATQIIIGEQPNG